MKLILDDAWGEKWGAHYATLAINASRLEHGPDGMDEARADLLFGHVASVLADAGEIAQLGPGGKYDPDELGKIVGTTALASGMLGDLHRHQKNGDPR